MSYTRNRGDPYWKRAKSDGISADGTAYSKGDRVFFYPHTGATYAGDSAPLYPNSLIADLTRIKTQIVQEAVAANPVLALDVLLDSLSGQLPLLYPKWSEKTINH